MQNKLLENQGILHCKGDYRDYTKEIEKLENKANEMQTGYMTKTRILALLKQAKKSNKLNKSALETRVIYKRALELYENYKNNY